MIWDFYSCSDLKYFRRIIFERSCVSVNSISLDYLIVNKIARAINRACSGTVYENVEPTSLQRIEDLGTGTCGHVVKMEHLPSGRVMAVKQMRKSGVPEENRRIYMDLDVVLRCTDCPHIVHCYGYFVTDSEVFILMTPTSDLRPSRM